VEPTNLEIQKHQLLKASEVSAEVEGSVVDTAEQSAAESAKDATTSTEKPGDSVSKEESPVDELEAEPDEEPYSAASSDTSSNPTPAETEEERARHIREEAKQSGPLEAILHAQPPEEVAKQHPAMSPPPYMHHFDTYSLVKQVQEGGFTQDQAITAMKGIRTLLAQNLDVAQASLVSKSDVENVRLRRTRRGVCRLADWRLICRRRICSARHAQS
jgi:hypothetical protein